MKMNLKLEINVMPLMEQLRLLLLSTQMAVHDMSQHSLEHIRETIPLTDYDEDDIECVWNFLSQHYPFTEDDIITYTHRLNYNFLLKNPHIEKMGISAEALDGVQLYNEINK